LRVPRPHRWGFPCCVRSPCTGVPSPLPRRNRCAFSLCPRFSRSGFLRRDSSLPSVPEVGFRVSIFEACSAFTHVTACLLAMAPLAPLSVEGSGGFVASTAAPIATGWSESCQAGLSPAVDLRLSTAHGTAYSSPSEPRAESRWRPRNFLCETGLPAAVEEMRYAAPKRERFLMRRARGGRIRGRRRVVAERVLRAYPQTGAGLAESPRESCGQKCSLFADKLLE
jgi:hypothetical protein